LNSDKFECTECFETFTEMPYEFECEICGGFVIYIEKMYPSWDD